MRRFGAAIVGFSQTTRTGLGFVFQQQYFVDHRHQMPGLQPRQGGAHRIAYLLRVNGLAADDHAQADDPRPCPPL